MNPKSHPIIFTSESVAAILAGRKTQTRRPLRFQPGLCEYVEWDDTMGWHIWRDVERTGRIDQDYFHFRCPYGKPGDALWVREPYWTHPDVDGAKPSVVPSWAVAYRPEEGYRRRNPLFMPRRLSRLLLRVTDIDVQRLPHISEEEAKAEGAPVLKDSFMRARDVFAETWDDIHHAHPDHRWSNNPMVWVVSFERKEHDDDTPSV